MKTLSQLIQEAISSFRKNYPANPRTGLTVEFASELEGFLKASIEIAVKESFKNTRVEEIKGATGHPAQFNYEPEYYQGWNSALSDKHNKEQKWINN